MWMTWKCQFIAEIPHTHKTKNSDDNLYGAHFNAAAVKYSILLRTTRSKMQSKRGSASDERKIRFPESVAQTNKNDYLVLAQIAPLSLSRALPISTISIKSYPCFILSLFSKREIMTFESYLHALTHDRGRAKYISLKCFRTFLKCAQFQSIAAAAYDNNNSFCPPLHARLWRQTQQAFQVEWYFQMVGNIWWKHFQCPEAPACIHIIFHTFMFRPLYLTPHIHLNYCL